MVAEIDRLTDTLIHNPQQFAQVERCPATRDVRITATGKRKNVVIYETTGSEVVILNISHQSARHRAWRRRLEEV